MAVSGGNLLSDIDKRHCFDANRLGLSMNYNTHIVRISFFGEILGGCENIVMGSTVVVHLFAAIFANPVGGATTR